MISLPAGSKIWLVAGVTDMRCGFTDASGGLVRSSRSITVNCYPGLWQINFPEGKQSKTDGMNTVSPQSDHHSLSFIAMQRAENDSGSISWLYQGDISFGGVCVRIALSVF